MHEWALVESILTASIEAAEREGLKKIKEINIGIGELQQIAIEAFEFAFEELTKSLDDKLKGVKIRFKTEKSNLACNNCRHEWSFDVLKKNINEGESEAIHFIPEVAFVHSRCPKCKSPDFEISNGRGVSILSIKGEK